MNHYNEVLARLYKHYRNNVVTIEPVVMVKADIHTFFITEVWLDQGTIRFKTEGGETDSIKDMKKKMQEPLLTWLNNYLQRQKAPSASW